MRRTKLLLRFEQLEQRILLAADISLVRYFDTWAAGVIRSTDVAGLTYHPSSGHLYLADSEINELPEFIGHNIFETSLAGDQVYRNIQSNNTEPTGIAYSEFDNFFYLVNDNRQTLQRYDDALNNPLATVVTTGADPSALDPEGVTADPDTGTLYVVDGVNGGMQVLVYDANLQFQTRFSISGEMQDGEGIALDPFTKHLFIVSSKDNAIFEYTVNGTFVQLYDISVFSPRPDEPQGLTFAPTSDPQDDPNAMAIYIADAMLDNFPDGRVFEAIVTEQQPPQNQAPNVDAGADQNHFVEEFATDAATLDGSVVDDGLPDPPAAISAFWTKISGPGDVDFADATAIDTTATFTAEGSYVLRLTANDGLLESSDDVTIEVQEIVDDTLITAAIQAISDDAEERRSGLTELASGDLDLGSKTVGLRFQEVGIFPGATIVDAYVQFQADESTSESTILTLRGEAADNPATFSSSSFNITTRPTTGASVSWSPAPWTLGQAGPDQRSPNLAVILQEIVDRPGWDNGQAVSLIIAGSGDRVAEPFGANGAAPVLHVRFVGGTPPPNQPPQADAGPDQSVVFPGLASLNGTASDDGQPSQLVTQWSQLSGPGSVSFGNANAVDTTAGFSAIGTYVLQLSADDGEFTTTDEVDIEVLDGSTQPTIVEQRIAAIFDDAEETNSGTVELVSGDLDLGKRIVGLRFDALGVFPGASVLEAYIQFQADETTSGSAEWTLRGEATDHSGPFEETPGNISSRPPTDASVSWTPGDWSAGQAGPAQRSPDIAAIIQEIINRPGWDNGGALSIIISGSGQRAAESVEGNQLAAPLLHVEFVGGTPPANEAPQVDAGPNQTIVLPSQVSLSATVSDDGQPGPVSTTWSQVSGPGGVTFADPNSVATTADFSLDGTYVLRLTADDTELSASDDIEITVLDSSTTVLTLDVPVAAGPDDAEERISGKVSLTSRDLELVRDKSPQTVGLRFNGISISLGASITYAYLQFQVDEPSSEMTTLTLEGQDIDHAPTFSGTDRDVTNRVRTSASIGWSPPAWNIVGEAGPNQQSTNIAPVIQEIVDRPGWVSGNSLAILVSGSGSRVAEAYDTDPAAAPRLHVEYVMPGEALSSTKFSPAENTKDVRQPVEESFFAHLYLSAGQRASAGPGETGQDGDGPFGYSMYTPVTQAATPRAADRGSAPQNSPQALVSSRKEAARQAYAHDELFSQIDAFFGYDDDQL